LVGNQLCVIGLQAVPERIFRRSRGHAIEIAEHDERLAGARGDPVAQMRDLLRESAARCGF
jgi:hypothetical protein